MKRRRLLAVLMALVMVITMVQGNWFVSKAADTSVDITVEDVSFKCASSGSWVDIDENTTLKNGDSIRLSFNWTLGNIDANGMNDDDIATATVNITDLTNVSLETKSETTFSDTNGTPMGTYSISGGVMTIKIPGSYLKKHSEYKGYANLDGNINASNDDNEAKKNVDIKATVNGVIVEKNIPVTFDIKKSELTVTKSLTSVADGKATYKVTIKNNDNGSVSEMKLTDQYGSLLSNATSFTYNNATYNSLTSLENKIGFTMEKSASVEFTYTMDISGDVYKQDSNIDNNGYNKLTVNYKNNAGEDKEASSTAKITDNSLFVKPSVTKSGSYNADSGKVTWTITVVPGSAGWDSVNMPSVTDTVNEYIGGEQNGDAQTKTITKGDFSISDDGKSYTYSYTTSASETAKSTNKGASQKNSVSGIIIKGNSYGATAEAAIATANWVSKAYVDSETEGDDTYYVWDITLDIPSDLSLTGDITVNDTTYNNNSGGIEFKQKNQDDVYIKDAFHNDYTKVDSTSKVDGIGILGSNNGGFGTWGEKQLYINLNKDYIEKIQGQADTSVTLRVKTKRTNILNKYENKAEVTYNGSKITATATHTEENYTGKKANGCDQNSNKKGSTAQFYVWVDLAKTDSIESAKKDDMIVFTDTLPENMEFESLDACGYGQVDGWFDSNNTGGSCDVDTSETGKVKFTVKLTEKMVGVINDVKSGTSKGVYVLYTLKVKDDYVSDFIEQTSAVAFKNKVSATYNGNTAGSADATAYLTPENVVDKSMSYTEGAPTTMSFTIDINKDGYDLVSGEETITCVDTMGTNLIYEEGKSSWKAVSVDSNGTETVLSNCTPSYDPIANTLTFDVPDGKHVKITYNATLNLYTNSADSDLSQKMTFENSGNSITIAGKWSDDTKDEVSVYTYAYSSNVGGRQETGSITLLKYFSDADGGVHSLAGSSFTIYKAEYGDTISKYTYDSGDEKSIFTTKALNDEHQWTIKDLTYDTVYVLVETGCADGYKLADPMYFVLPGSDYAKVNKTDQLTVINTGNYLRFENEEDDSAKIKITKTITGLDDTDITDEVKKATQFVITDTSDDTKTWTKTLSDFTKNTDGTYECTISVGSAGGTYKIEETAAGVTNAECAASYSTDGTNYTTGAICSSLDVNAGATSSVYFKNAYTKTVTGSLTVTKLFGTGSDLNATTLTDAQKKAIVFTVSGPDDYSEKFSLFDILGDNGTASKTLTGLELGTYTVTESNGTEDGGALSGYTCTTTAKVGAGNATDGSTTTVTLSETTSTASVLFTNTYEEKTYDVEISKVDMAGGQEIEGAELSIYKGDYGTTSTDGAIALLTWTSGEDKEASGTLKPHTVKLAAGTYTLEEKTAPDGYETAEKIVFTVGSDGNVTSTTSGAASGNKVTMKDEKKDTTGTLKITKTIKGAVTEDEVKGALSFTVKKADDASDTGTTYYLTNADGGFKYNSITKQWELELTETAGGYTVTENVTDADGYTIASVTSKIGDGEAAELTGAAGDKSTTYAASDAAVVVGETTTVAFENNYAKKVKISKVAMVGGEELAGASIKLSTTDGSIIDSDGEAAKEDTWISVADKPHEVSLTAGTYKFEEIVAPTGYKVTSEVSFTVGPDGKITIASDEISKKYLEAADSTNGASAIKLKNETKTLVIKIKKKFDEGSEVTKEDNDSKWNNLKFVIKDSEGTVVAEPTMNSLGGNDDGYMYVEVTSKVATFTYGTYTIEEVGADVAAIAGDYEWTYEVGGSDVTAVAGKAAGKVTFAASDASSDNSIVKTIEFVNDYQEKTGTDVEISKVDATGGEEIEGAKLTITGKTVYGDEVTKSWTSGDDGKDENGKIKTHKVNLKEGTYTLTETTAPYGYDIAESITFTVGSDGTITKTDSGTSGSVDGKKITMKDEHCGNLIITKTINGPVTEDEVKGSLTFKVESDTKVIGTYTLDKNFKKGNDGVWTMTLPLAKGSYKVTETVTDVDGIVLASVTNKVGAGSEEELNKVGSSYTGQTVNVTTGKDTTTAFANNYERVVEISKTDVAGAEIEGAELKIYKGTDTTEEDNVVESWTSGKTSHKVKLEAGTYTLVEKTAPLGYEVAESITFVVGSDGKVKVSGKEVSKVAMTDELKEYSVEISKVDATDGEEIEGAKLTITGKTVDGEEVTESWTSGVDGKDDNGNIKTHKVKLKAGTYTLTETTAPYGYDIAESITFVVGMDGKVDGGEAKVVMTDEHKLGTIKFTKAGYYNEKCSADAALTKALEGAVFELKAEDGQKKTCTSGKDGSVTFNGLVDGTYEIREIEAPDGYKLDETVYTAKLADGEFVGLTGEDGRAVAGNVIVNNIETTDISLMKVAEENKGIKLRNSRYGLYRTRSASTSPVAVKTTDERGVLTFEGVLMNTEYTIKELSAPDGSYVSEKPITIKFTNVDGVVKAVAIDLGADNGKTTATVDENGNITWLEPSVRYTFDKVDENGKALSGATLAVIDASGNVVSQWVTDGSSYSLDRVLVAGQTYILRELKAPGGYEIADDVTFVVPSDAVSAGEDKVISIKMTDKLKTEIVTETETSVTTQTTTETTTATTITKTPQTGDTVPVAAIAVIMLVALAGAGGVVIYKKRKEN